MLTANVSKIKKRVWVNMRKHITLQVSVIWYTTFIVIPS